MKSLWDHVHWFVTERCNLECVHCFRPRSCRKEKESELLAIAELIGTKAKKVSITGGEPTLVKSLPRLLHTFKQKGIYVSLHTNGSGVNRRVSQFQGLVDDIAVPLDSLDRETQATLKGTDYLPIALRVIEQIRDSGINLGVHTVFTDLNASHMPAMYRHLKKHLDHWNVYEYNPDLVADRFRSCQRFLQVQSLEGTCEYKNGATDCLFGRFLEMEDKIAKHKDKRVHFVSLRDYRPYVFVDPSGDVYHSLFFSGSRVKIGNILSQGVEHIDKELAKARAQGVLFDQEGFLEIQGNLPLFARLYEGNYDDQEVDEVDNRSWPRIARLHDLYIKRFYGKKELARARKFDEERVA